MPAGTTRFSSNSICKLTTLDGLRAVSLVVRRAISHPPQGVGPESKHCFEWESSNGGTCPRIGHHSHTVDEMLIWKASRSVKLSRSRQVDNGSSGRPKTRGKAVCLLANRHYLV